MTNKNILVLAIMCCLAGPALGADGARPFQELSYSPSGIMSETQLQRGITEKSIRADLEKLAAVTGRIRTYTVDRGLDNVPAVAKDLGLKVSLGLWLGSDHGKNEAEVKKAIAVAVRYADVIDRIIVGNEVLERGDLPAKDLVLYIRQVKRAVAATRIPVSTAATWGIWLKNPELAAAGDFIGAHLLPYWDGVSIVQSQDYVMRRFRELRDRFPEKKIFIAETGWPSAGPTERGAVPTPENQAVYIRTFISTATKEGYDYNIVEAYDQPWKASQEGAVGAFWGLYDKNRQSKFGLTGPGVK